VLLNRVSIYTDAETNIERTEIRQAFGKQFQMTHSSLSSPILAPQNLESLQSSPQTQLIIIDKNHHETLKALKEIFPQLSKLSSTDLTDHTLLSFYDHLNRPIIILYTINDLGMETLVQQMQKLQFFDRKKIIQHKVE